MTTPTDFLTKFEGLIERTTKRPWRQFGGYSIRRPGGLFSEPGSNENGEFICLSDKLADAEFICFLANHAPAIAQLVRDAKEYYDAQQEWAKHTRALEVASDNFADASMEEKAFMAAGVRVSNAEHALKDTLAALNEEKK